MISGILREWARHGFAEAPEEVARILLETAKALSSDLLQ